METGENNPISIQSDNFNIALANSYHLSIQLGINHFSYCLLNTTTFTYEYFKAHIINSSENTATNISTIINEDAILKERFSSQSIAFVNFPSTLVPNELYKEEDVKAILAFNTEVKGKILSDKLQSEDVMLVYDIPEDILNIVETYFPEAKQRAQQSILIDQYNKLAKTKEKAIIYINNGIANISLLKNNKLVFNNSFTFTTKEDLLYYTLFSFEQLKVSPDKIETILFGTIEKNSGEYNLLYDYIRNIEMGKRPHQFVFPPAFDKIKEHKYFGLFSQILCV